MKLRIGALLLLLFAAGRASADITFRLNIYQETKPAYDTNYGATWYYAFPSLETTNPPVSYHLVESPGSACRASVGTNTGVEGYIFTNPAQLFDALTNGAWKLWLNKDTAEEEFYTFTLHAELLSTNSLGGPKILTPANGAINVASNTSFAWTGPDDWDQLTVESYRDNLLDHQTASLLPPEKAWTNGPVLLPGTNCFVVTYRQDVTAQMEFSTPTNYFLGALTDWVVAGVTLQAQAKSGFLTEGLPSTALGLALDAPGLVWETSGESGWYGQTTNAHDWVDAAQSGSINDYSYSRLRTVLYGSHTISFWWKSDCEGFADYIEFSHNGIYVDDLTGDTGWRRFTYSMADEGVHVLEWTYYKDVSIAEGADAAFLDGVNLENSRGSLPSGQPVNFSLTLLRQQRHAFDALAPNAVQFSAVPKLTGPTNPISYHRLESPSNEFFGPICSLNWGGTNTGTQLAPTESFADLVNGLTNGVWHLWLNRESPQEECYQFTFAAMNFASNDLGLVTFECPTNGGLEIPLAPQYQWSALGNWDSLQIEASPLPGGSAYALSNLSPTATNWPGGPLLLPGTNVVQVRYQRNATTNFLVSVPFFNWTLTGVKYECLAASGFVAVTPVSPPVLNIWRTETNTVAISWPSSASGFQLVSNSDLTTTNWNDVAVLPVDEGTNFVVIIDPPAGPNFFRLEKP